MTLGELIEIIKGKEAWGQALGKFNWDENYFGPVKFQIKYHGNSFIEGTFKYENRRVNPDVIMLLRIHFPQREYNFIVEKDFDQELKSGMNALIESEFLSYELVV